MTKVRPAAGLTLRVHFAADGRDYDLDMTGFFARSAHFAPLLSDAEAFASVSIVENGLGVAWPVETRWGPLDVSADTLRRIAEEQQPMTGADFSAWRTKLGLSLTEAAKLLGLGRRTIMGYLKKDELPSVVAIACRALARDKSVLAAHYVPAGRSVPHPPSINSAQHPRQSRLALRRGSPHRPAVARRSSTKHEA
ncbi:MAG TPA: hypothetical protein VL993_00760 [Stellaceae bacterium]|nr:hypothetical protein [Stellaceae bacterium]